MTKSFRILLSIPLFIMQYAGAQNWAPVNCYDPAFGGIIFVDTLQNEIIFNYDNVNQVCGKNFKGCLAYNQFGFHTLDFGIDLHNSNPNTGGDRIIGSIPYQGKSLMYGNFASVGNNALPAEALALWDGNKWRNFPKYAFTFDPQRINSTIIYKIYNDNGKLWFLGDFQNLGGVSGKNLYTFDGSNYTLVSIPASVFDRMTGVIRFRNDLIFSGFFYNIPYNSFSKIARYNGSNWLPMGNGINGSFDGIWDMAIYQDTLFMAGTINKNNGNPGNYIIKWDGTAFYDGGFGSLGGTDAIKKLVVYKNRLYAFGNFLHAANKKAFGIAYYEKGKWTVPQDSLDNSINSAVVYNDELYISGGFRSINGDQSFNTLAKLRCPDFDAASGCISGINKNSKNDLNFSVFPNPTNDKVRIKSNNSSTDIQSITIINSLGQEIFKNSNYTSNNEIDLSNYSNGLYYLIIKTNAGYSRHKIQKE